MNVERAGATAARPRPEPLKHRILHAAMAEFAEHGYHRSSLRTIAERSGATKPMIYYHFQGKDGLYAATVEHQMEALEARLIACAALGGDARTRLRRFATTYMTCYRTDFPALAFGLRELPTLPPDVFANILRNYWRRIVAVLQRILQEGVAAGELREHDVENCTRGILGIMHFYIRIADLEPEEAVEAAVTQVADYYALGLLASADGQGIGAPR
jgi:AcrR family transcriptional regulator